MPFQQGSLCLVQPSTNNAPGGFGQWSHRFNAQGVSGDNARSSCNAPECAATRLLTVLELPLLTCLLLLLLLLPVLLLPGTQPVELTIGVERYSHCFEIAAIDMPKHACLFFVAADPFEVPLMRG